MTDIYHSSINELSRLVKEQKFSPVEIVDMCLKRVEALNPKLNSIISILKDSARELAEITGAR